MIDFAGVFWYNAIWFMVFILVAFLCGMVYEYDKRIAMILLIIFVTFMVIGCFIVILHWQEATSGSGDSGVMSWYYYIGSVLGGWFADDSFKKGRKFYKKGD